MLELVIISGMSGSGKTTALRALEDLGFFCVDNLPVGLIPQFVELCASSWEVRRSALVVDVREGEFLRDLDHVVEELRRRTRLRVLFLECDDEVLRSRFRETRRRHPLAPEGDLREAMRRERELLRSLRELADWVLDTSGLSPHRLRELVQRELSGAALPRTCLEILSFGYRWGVPPEADLVMDVRFLPNPYFVEKLSSLPGTDRRVADYVLSSRESKLFLEKTLDLLDFLIPLYAKEGKSYLTIGIGCTGGRHRSVAIAEAIQNSLSAKGIGSTLRHRDLTIKTDRGEYE